MSEDELLEALGSPKKIERIDENTKMFLYRQVDRGGFIFWSYIKRFQIILKDKVVINITYLDP